jgi:hypothetical protein
MRIIGCDLHARQQTLAMLDTETGEVVNRTLLHEGNEVRKFYSQLPQPCLVYYGCLDAPREGFLGSRNSFRQFRITMPGFSLGGWRPPGEPVDIPFFGRENVPYEVTDGFKTAIAMRPGAGFQNVIAVLPKPVAPFFSLPLRVIHKVTQAHLKRHWQSPTLSRHVSRNH